MAQGGGNMIWSLSALGHWFEFGLGWYGNQNSYHMTVEYSLKSINELMLSTSKLSSWPC